MTKREDCKGVVCARRGWALKMLGTTACASETETVSAKCLLCMIINEDLDRRRACPACLFSLLLEDVCSGSDFSSRGQ